jgi:predicted nucleotidyltransferase
MIGVVLDIIRQVMDRPEVIFGYLFGSRAEGRVLAWSDIDLGIFFDLTRCADVEEVEEDIREEMIKRTGVEWVDIVRLNSAPDYWRWQAINGQLLFSRDESRRVDYETRVTTRYLDWKYYEDLYDEAVAERIREQSHARRAQKSLNAAG